MTLPFELPSGKIFFCGLPASGKSTTAKQLSEKYNRAFFDLDVLIELHEQKTIKEIFATKGETYFREEESKILQQYAFPLDAIIALGGGTPCFFNNLNWLKCNGTLIYLKKEINVLVERIEKSETIRPLFQNISTSLLHSQLTELLVKREPYYLEAHHIIF
jgi:shikimate kinase